MSPQADYVVSNGTGAAVRSDINNQLAAIVSNNSGATEPATMYAYQWWADTSTGLLKLRNAANNAWITLRELDGTLTIEAGTVSAPGLAFASDLNTGIYSPSADQLGITTGGTVRLTTTTTGITSALPVDVPLGTDSAPTVTFTGDLNTGIYSPGADQVAITTNGVERVEWGTSEVVFNDGGANYDFRIEGDTNSSLFFVDASAEAVGIGTTSFSGNEKLNVSSSTGSTALSIKCAGGGLYTASLLFGAEGFGNFSGLEFDDPNNRLRLYTTGNRPLLFSTDSTERARIDNSGRLLVGTSTATNNLRLGQKLAVVTTEANFGGVNLTSYSGTTASNGPLLDFQRSRGTTDGSFTKVESGDRIGGIAFRGADGSQFVDGALILAVADGATGGNDLPTRLEFHTTADGASSSTERARINNAGYFKATSDGTYNSATGTQHEFRQNASGSDALLITSTNASLAAGTLEVNATRAANTAYNFFRGWSSSFGDLEFNLRGDGNAFADGTWSGGGADYAEYFEWSDGNPDEEDRRGISVVLDGNQIRPAVDGEDPIGVISGNPSVVGDAAWNKWSGKYLRDDYGTYIQEDYEVVNDEGETVIQQRRKLNPAYDPDQEYVRREQRPEWDCVGLMGKLRIRKGQPTGSRWIKMRDISDSVEEWLVR